MKVNPCAICQRYECQHTWGERLAHLRKESPAPGENAEAEDVEAVVYERSKQFYWPKVEDAEPKPMSAEELEREHQIQAEVIQPDRTRLRLLATIAARDAEIERLQMDGIHICSSQCRRTACVLRREIDALKARAEAAEARVRELERLLKAMTELASENDDDAGKAQDERDTALAEAARLREAVGPLVEALENAAEYAPQALPHLADLPSSHQRDHAIHFVKQTEAWIENALAAYRAAHEGAMRKEGV